MNSTILNLLLIFFGGYATPAVNYSAAEVSSGISELYDDISWSAQRPGPEVFYRAVEGYNRLQDSLHIFEKPLLTIIDFSRPSNYERLWVVNLETKEVLIQTLVAHGRNSGEIIPNRFSNKMESLQSSLGFYRTGSVYYGKHGLSLKLQGLEPGINDHAERRAIVVHGADYVSERYIARNGRLGRSQGCPAVAMDVYKQLINVIGSKTCLFIYYPEKEYFERSMVFKQKEPAHQLAYHSSFVEGKF